MAIQLKIPEDAYIDHDGHGKIWIDGREVIGWSLEYRVGIPIWLVPVLKPKCNDE